MSNLKDAPQLAATHSNLSEYAEDTPNIDLIKRRQRHLSIHSFYDQPLHIIRGEGSYLKDYHGRQYLDCYNNVASLGHCHTGS